MPSRPESGAQRPPTSPVAVDETTVARMALVVVDQIPAMVAYWDQDERCRFANRAYLDWFGRSREQLLGTTLRELLGPLYPLNEPFVRAAYAGRTQTFERRIPLPDGTSTRDSLATYTPDVVDGVVRGIFVHVADSTLLKEKERELEQTIAERDRTRARLRTLEGLLPICANCKRIRNDVGEWTELERYVSAHTQVEFSHGICERCVHSLYPEFEG